jgi:hypothetical protein
MGTHAQAQCRPCIEIQPDSLQVLWPTGGDESDADIARSEKNILQWMTYLPDDCIRMMILMGWDITT